ncbi:hypothetical protein SADUNF_Sadunf01G0177400 [Salix dunnii]|uniref:TF-B3 domain-containing protein n=1 Tax=Salix dunnii TaxID=1413687 RepID=A0A835NCA5_9ROSI|nr:hypothetical protein SADUNF_Sadunf01G0177400 [Salix dunnii]
MKMIIHAAVAPHLVAVLFIRLIQVTIDSFFSVVDGVKSGHLEFNEGWVEIGRNLNLNGGDFVALQREDHSRYKMTVRSGRMSSGQLRLNPSTSP